MTVQIRQSVPSDNASIAQLHLEAFGPGEGPEIAALIGDLFNDHSARPLFSFVAVNNKKILGHILFTRAVIVEAPEEVSVQILAPLAVLPTQQSTGIGSRLIEHGLGELRKAGVDLVFVLGHPGYYPRTGFEPALPLGLTAPYPIPAKNADAWMVQALRGSLIGRVLGRVQCSNALNEPQLWRE